MPTTSHSRRLPCSPSGRESQFNQVSPAHSWNGNGRRNGREKAKDGGREETYPPMPMRLDTPTVFSERLQNLLLWWGSYSADRLICRLMSKPLWGPICRREFAFFINQHCMRSVLYVHCSMRFWGCSKIKVECPDAWEGMWGSETPNEWMEQLPNWKGEKKRERVSERMIGAKFWYSARIGVPRNLKYI